MGLSGYSILRDPANALDRLGNSDILGMEDVYQWKLQSGVAPGNSTNHTQGTFSVSLTNPGTTELRSDPFALTATLPASITIDLFIPTGGATGNAFMFVDCPSKGLTRFNIGNVSLSGRTQNAFNTLTFNQVPVSQIGNSCPDFRLTVRLQAVGSGTYLLDNVRGPANVPATPLPSREFEVPTIVQSRSFRADGEVYYPLASQAQPGETVGANPDVNPYWLLMFDGETNVVNGTVWPNMNVQRHAYRFRFLNSSNQRFYRMTAVERHAVHDHRRGRRLHPQPADGHRVQHRRHRARRHDHRLLQHPGGHEDRPAEHRAAAAADRRGRRIRTRTARSCSSRSWPARRSRRGRCRARSTASPR